MVNMKLHEILAKSESGERLSREELVYILGFKPASPESAYIRAMGDRIMRSKTNNGAIITGQIGVDVHPCEAACQFCSFCEGYTGMPTFKVDKATVKEAIDGFCREGDLYGLYLMTMADCDKDNLLDMVAYAVRTVPKETQIWVNIADQDKAYYKELAAAGAKAAYHVCRMGEGKYTKLNPATRIKSMEYIKEAGMDLMSCCEPIGTEHSPQEIAENMEICMDMDVKLYGAMKRVAVPGSPLFDKKQISNLAMAHYVACTALDYAHVANAR